MTIQEQLTDIIRMKGNITRNQVELLRIHKVKFPNKLPEEALKQFQAWERCEAELTALLGRIEWVLRGSEDFIGLQGIKDTYDPEGVLTANLKSRKSFDNEMEGGGI